MFLFLTSIIVGQEKTNVEMAISKLLSGDFKVAGDNFSNAISTDTIVYENYYLRGVNKLFQNDTLGAVADFNNAIRLKLSKNKSCHDSLINSIMAVRPKDNSGQHSHPYSLDSNLFKIQLATWLFLVDNNVKESCNTFRQLEKHGFKNVKTLSVRACR